MKNLIIFTFIIITFNACSITSNHKVNSSLQFEPVPEDKRVTYVFFGKERFMQEVIEEDEFSDIEDSLAEEYSKIEAKPDPLEKYNRAVTTFNDYIYENALNPVAKSYANIVNEDIRIGISNFFHNITFPIRFVNNILQFKFNNAAEETGRFIVNSTVGVLGFMDPAKEKLNLNKREEDFGQTLGYYGFGEGFHIVLPLYGPSNLRDSVGMFADRYVNPLSHTGNEKYKIPDRAEKTIAIDLYKTVNSTSLNLGKYENLKKDSIDLYPFLKDIYTQNREKQIKE